MLRKFFSFLFRKIRPAGNSDYNYSAPGNFTLQRLRINSRLFSQKPLISVLIPTYNTPAGLLRQCVESVLHQAYENWELCIADDNSTSAETIDYLNSLRENPKVKILFRKENGHIARCSNSAMELATGEYCALLDHDDVLAQDALYEVVNLLQKEPQLDFIYTNEDKIDEQNKHFDPVYKPSWNPDTFLSWNFVCHLAVFRTSILKNIGGFRPEYNGSQDYDLILRFTEQTKNIRHLPKILYHWRMHALSVAMNTHSKPYAYINGKKALEDALRRRWEKGAVEMHLGEMLGMYTVRYKLYDHPLISIIIPTRDRASLVRTCVQSIFDKSTYRKFEIILVDNNSTETSLTELISEYKKEHPRQFHSIREEIPFNFSALMNAGARAAKGEYLLLLNNDTKVISEDWLEGLLEQAQRTSVGAVGARLLFKNNTIQHAGIELREDALAEHVYSYLRENDLPPQADCIQNYPAVTAAALMVSKAKYDQVKGFDENLAVDYNDIDFCLKLKEAGYHNVCVPFVKLYHYESISRGKEKKSLDKYSQYLAERKNFTEKWTE
jgi:O-antigen biosynthesis protein